MNSPDCAALIVDSNKNAQSSRDAATGFEIGIVVEKFDAQ